jgi:hypothetical protein
LQPALAYVRELEDRQREKYRPPPQEPVTGTRTSAQEPEADLSTPLLAWREVSQADAAAARGMVDSINALPGNFKLTVPITVRGL